MQMKTQEWNHGSGGTGEPVPTADDGSQMPLGLGGEAGANGFESASVDSGPKRSINGFLMLVIILAVGGGGLFAMRMGNLIGPQDASAQATEKKIDEALKRFAVSGKTETAASAKA